MGMSREPLDTIDRLLAYHLGTADADATPAFQAQLASDAALQQQSQRLRRILQPLQTYDVRTPPQLTASILQHIAAYQAAPLKMTPVSASERAGRSPTISWRDLMSAAAAVALFVGVMVPGYQAARRASQRALCMDQMRGLGAAFQGYAASNAGFLPYGGPPQESLWVLDRGATLPKAPSTLEVLSRSGFGANRPPFTCPSDVRGPSGSTGYSAQNFVQPRVVSRISSEFPIVSDPNPLIENGVVHPSDDGRNSDVHGRNAGQTVLRIGGSAEWQTRPTIGIARDNIFQINNLREYNVREPLSSISDAFLVP